MSKESQQWHFVVEAESPIYFWNQVLSYVNCHDKRLDTQEYGPLLLETPGKPQYPDPATYYYVDAHSCLAVVVNSIDPERIPTDDEIAAFFDPENTDGPKTLYFPTRVVVFDCCMSTLSATRQSVDLRAWLPEAVTYVTDMLQGLGYPELRVNTDGAQTRPQLPTPPDKDAARDAWLQYYQDMQDSGRRYTLTELARDMHLSHGRVKHLRGLWLAGHPQYQKDSTK